MTQFVTADEFRDRFVDATGLADEKVNAALTAASDYFVERTGLTFAVAPDSAADAFFYGKGTRRLEIGPHVEALASDAVSLPDGYEVPEWEERGDWLYALGGAVWPDDVRVTVHGRFGSSSYPADVREAVILICIAQFEEQFAQAESGWKGRVGIDFDVPPRAQEAIDRQIFQAEAFTL